MGIITNKGELIVYKTFSGFIFYFSGFSKKVPVYLSGTDYFRSRINKKSMNRNVKLISILSLGLMLGACGGNSSSQEEAIIVKTATANTYSNETVKEFPIITQPFRTTELSFRVSGPIDRLDVYAGNYYRRGDIIAEIDHETTASGVNVLKPSIARQRQSMSVSVRFIRKTTFLPVLMRKHVRNILPPKLLSTLPSMNWKIPAL